MKNKHRVVMTLIPKTNERREFWSRDLTLTMRLLIGHCRSRGSKSVRPSRHVTTWSRHVISRDPPFFYPPWSYKQLLDQFCGKSPVNTAKLEIFLSLIYAIWIIRLCSSRLYICCSDCGMYLVRLRQIVFVTVQIATPPCTKRRGPYLSASKCPLLD